jgi:hypothetical protein
MNGAVRAVALLCAVSVIAPACTDGQTHSKADFVTLPTSSWRPGDASHLARVEGIVQGSANVDGVCVWLASARGSRIPLVWPAGFYARFSPLRIYDGSGSVVAKQGQRIQAGGGQEPIQGHRCMLGQRDAFVIQSSVAVIGR